MFAEPSVVPGTVPYLEGLCVDVKVLTVLVGALAEPLKEVADGHLGHFILVEEFTVVSLLAEVAHPVFADHRPLSSHVPERTVASSRAHSVQVELAQSRLVLCSGIVCQCVCVYVCVSLSIFGKGSGMVPVCFSSWSSISNS